MDLLLKDLTPKQVGLLRNCVKVGNVRVFKFVRVSENFVKAFLLLLGNEWPNMEITVTNAL